MAVPGWRSRRRLRVYSRWLGAQTHVYRKPREIGKFELLVGCRFGHRRGPSETEMYKFPFKTQQKSLMNICEKGAFEKELHQGEKINSPTGFSKMPENPARFHPKNDEKFKKFFVLPCRVE